MVPGAKGFPGDAKRLAFQLDFTTYVWVSGHLLVFGTSAGVKGGRYSRKKLDDFLIDKSARKGRRKRRKNPMADTIGKLKTAYDLAKDLVNLQDTTARQGKVAELQRQILDAQESKWER